MCCGQDDDKATTAVYQTLAREEQERLLTEERDLLQYFDLERLSPREQDTAYPFNDLARRLVFTLPKSHRRSMALAKLLEARGHALNAIREQRGR